MKIKKKNNTQKIRLIRHTMHWCLTTQKAPWITCLSFNIGNTGTGSIFDIHPNTTPHEIRKRSESRKNWFQSPSDHPDTQQTLLKLPSHEPLQVSVGCAKWNRAELKVFYPRGTKDELSYYSRQFNSIELNATHYGVPKKEQILIWKEKTPADFKFFPKIPQSISKD